MAETTTEAQWLLARFRANEEDYRPVKWPPVGPYWCTGYGEGYSTVVAYVRTAGQIVEFWPEAWSVDIQGRGEIEFSDRFPKPKWWPIEEARP